MLSFRCCSSNFPRLLYTALCRRQKINARTLATIASSPNAVPSPIASAGEEGCDVLSGVELFGSASAVVDCDAFGDVDVFAEEAVVDGGALLSEPPRPRVGAILMP
jgi:hypothetical protein